MLYDGALDVLPARAVGPDGAAYRATVGTTAVEGEALFPPGRLIFGT
jgi:hypothetical protein